MDNNDIVRRLRYALTLSNSEMAGIFKLAGHDIQECEILDIFKKEKETGYVECSDSVLSCFLDGLIILKRGQKQSLKPQPKAQPETPMSNNMVLKKLRIALNLKEEDMFEMFKRAEFSITKPELSALFRKPGSKNYKVCGDQILKKFLHGVTVFFRPPE